MKKPKRFARCFHRKTEAVTVEVVRWRASPARESLCRVSIAKTLINGVAWNISSIPVARVQSPLGKHRYNGYLCFVDLQRQNEKRSSSLSIKFLTHSIRLAAAQQKQIFLSASNNYIFISNYILNFKTAFLSKVGAVTYRIVPYYSLYISSINKYDKILNVRTYGCIDIMYLYNDLDIHVKNEFSYHTLSTTLG